MLKKILVGVLVAMVIMGNTAGLHDANAVQNYSQTSKQLDEKAYTEDDLGAVYSKDKTIFKVWAPTAQKVVLNLYKTGSDEEENSKTISNTEMEFNAETAIWSITINEDLAGVYYTYSITVDGTTNETGDIYAKAAGVNGERSMVVDLSKTNPKDWEDDKNVFVQNQTDAIVWEVHIKDFSNQEESGVKKEYRGKYLAFTQNDTTLSSNSDLPTCVNYLKSLGVNYIQINPFYDFGSIDEAGSDDQFNWGYDPKNYNVPEGSYSTNPYDGNVRINETKQMIKALHDAGIGVVMDVVYNHTYTGEDSFFNKTVPNYYYRFTQSNEWSNGSGCGNDTASEHLMFRKYMVDSIKYWAKEYHIDGFRFDLMGLHDVDTMNEIRDALDELDSRILIYGEAWDLDTSSESEMATQRNMKHLNNRIAAFNDGVRDAIKGSNFEKLEPGFVQGKFNRVAIEGGIKAATADWALTPNQTVTYSSCHDNNTLYDKLVQSVRKDKSFRERNEQLVAMNKLAAAVTLTSQGMPFVLAGEEFARSKDGDHNSYVSSPLLNQIDWTSLEKYGDLTAYYKGLIDIRKNYSPMRDATNKTIENMKFYDLSDDKVIAYTMKNTINEETEWNYVTCIFNNSSKNDKIISLENESLPEDLVVVANDEKAGVTILGETKKSSIKIPKSSSLILVDKESFVSVKLETEKLFAEKLISATELNLQAKKETVTNIKVENQTQAQKPREDTGNPLIPAILAGAMALLATISGIVIYTKQRKLKKNTQTDNHKK